MSTLEIYISVDIETSGPFPPAFSMLSIGACVVGKIKTTYYAELQPISKRIIPEAMKVVGKPIKHFVLNGHDPKNVMRDFEAWVKTVAGARKPVFVGFNSAFDWAFVNWYFHTYLQRNLFGVSPIDIKAYYMGLSGCIWEDTRSSRLPKIFKGSIQQTHNALDDAKAQAQMFEKMLGYDRQKLIEAFGKQEGRKVGRNQCSAKKG